MPRRWLGVGVLAIVASVGCSDRSSAVVAPCAGADAGCRWEPSPTWTFSVPNSEESPEADVLFVIDDTAAMAGVASRLPAQYSALASALTNLPPAAGGFLGNPGAAPIHVAFIPSTLPSADCPAPGARGAPCGLSGSDQFLIRGECGIEPNFSGSLGDALSCLGDLGLQGCGLSQPLEAARRALGGDPYGGALTGRSSFPSPGADLLIVIITAQDDMSTSGGASVPIADYLQFFADLSLRQTGSPYGVSVSVVGPGDHCAPERGVTPVPTPRLDELVAASPLNGTTSLCDGSLAPALRPIEISVGIVHPPPCVSGIRNANVGRPDCVVEDRFEEVDGSEVEIAVPLCESTTPTAPCWSLVPAGGFNNCPSGSWGFSAGAASCPPLLDRVQITCRGCADPNDPACAGPTTE